MRISELVETLTVGLNDLFVIDGLSGTKKFSFENLLNSVKSKLNYLDFLEGDIPVEQRRNTWRGKNLGHSVTEAQWNAIADGSFKGLFLGDYWEIDNRIWRIVDFDYWLGAGDVECTTHHLVIMPDHTLYNAKMNDTNITTGGYAGSKFYTTYCANAVTIINTAFGESHKLNHRECLTNATASGRPSGVAWYSSTFELPNEIMIYGTHIMAIPTGDSQLSTRYTIDCTQLALMRICREIISKNNENYWLRDISSGPTFSMVGNDRVGAADQASIMHGVRPVFGICKENLDTMPS